MAALTAFRSGDRAGAVRELSALAEAPGLTAEQHQAVRGMLTLALQPAPRPIANPSVAAPEAPQKPPQTATTAPAPPTAASAPAVAAPGTAVTTPGAQGSVPPTASGETPSGGAAFTLDSLASPFARANQALKEGFDAALIAFQVGDYTRAVGEIELLAQTPNLTAEQERTLLELLARTLAAAPELEGNAEGSATPPR